MNVHCVHTLLFFHFFFFLLSRNCIQLIDHVLDCTCITLEVGRITLYVVTGSNEANSVALVQEH